MTRPSDNRPSDVAVVDFLRSHHGSEPQDLEVLSGGFWSAAFGYRLDSEELVLRLNDAPDGFLADQLAMRYGSPELPVPEVLAIGEAFGRWFAISRRHRGRFLESAGPDEAGALGPTVVDLLAALRAVPDTDEVDGRASKAISDALRWEIRRGRAVRVARSLYSTGKMPTSTRYWIRSQVREMQQRAA